MRIRVLIASGIFGLALLFGAPSMAQAQPPTTMGGHGAPAAPGAVPAPSAATGAVPANVEAAGATAKESYECFEKQLKEAKPSFKRCIQAPSPILPAMNEIIFGGSAFVILLIVMAKFAYPAMKAGMDGRTERIRADLARADEAKVEAEQVLAEYQARVASAKAEATRIIEDARVTADGLKADLQKRAEAEIAETRQRAAADIEAAKAQAVADLRGEVASLAIGAAEVVVAKSLDQATQIQLVENYINSVGARN